MNLELNILLILRNVSDLLMPETTLVQELRLRDVRDSLSEIQTALRSLESAREITGVTSRDQGPKWRLADQGRARLADANL